MTTSATATASPPGSSGSGSPPPKRGRIDDDAAADATATSPSPSSSSPSYAGPALELKCVNTIRALGADMPQAANSGHPGAPMGCAPMAHLLWAEVMNYSPSDARWYNRDRFVLSNGHACALQYAMLHLAGYGLSLDDLKQFRQLGSKTPGHPESFMTEGEFFVCLFGVFALSSCVEGNICMKSQLIYSEKMLN